MRLHSYLIIGLSAFYIQLAYSLRFKLPLCLEKFNYHSATDGDRWYGNITLPINSAIEDFRIRIELDKPSDSLVTTGGPVTSTENRIYFITNDNDVGNKEDVILKNGSTFELNFMVNFQTRNERPKLKYIHFNGERICHYLNQAITIQPSFSEVSNSEVGGMNNIRNNNASSHNSDGNSNTCGLVPTLHPLITSESFRFNEWPWHVALFKRDEVNSSVLSYFCGGSLVSKNKIITAANCVSLPMNNNMNPDSLIAYFGKFNISMDESGSQKRKISSVKVHPYYSMTNFHNDIAILSLQEDVEFTDIVQPLCLWEASESSQDIVGKNGMVAGWGYDEYGQLSKTLKQTTMSIVSKEKCAQRDPHFFKEYVSRDAFCGGSLNGVYPCKGDTGGGLILRRRNLWYLRGIISGLESTSMCLNYNYTVFTDIAKYTDFIEENM